MTHPSAPSSQHHSSHWQHGWRGSFTHSISYSISCSKFILIWLPPFQVASRVCFAQKTWLSCNGTWFLKWAFPALAEWWKVALCQDFWFWMVLFARIASEGSWSSLFTQGTTRYHFKSRLDDRQVLDATHFQPQKAKSLPTCWTSVYGPCYYLTGTSQGLS